MWRLDLVTLKSIAENILYNNIHHEVINDLTIINYKLWNTGCCYLGTKTPSWFCNHDQVNSLGDTKCEELPKCRW